MPRHLQRPRPSATASPSLRLQPTPLRPRLSLLRPPARTASPAKPAGGRGASATANKNTGMRDEKTARKNRAVLFWSFRSANSGRGQQSKFDKANSALSKIAACVQQEWRRGAGNDKRDLDPLTFRDGGRKPFVERPGAVPGFDLQAIALVPVDLDEDGLACP